MLILSLALLGLGLVFGSFVLDSYNVGSCPEAAGNPYFHPSPVFPLFGNSFCDHTMMVGGITFWIGHTAEGVLGAGTVLLISSLAIGLSGMSRHLTGTKS